ALFDDEFMQMYIEKRMREMELKAASQVKVFGEIIDLQDGDEFLKAIDGEEAFVSILVYIFEDDAEGCMAISKILRISASAVGFSNYFKNNGVPALLHYKAENLVASFPKMVEQLGRDFYANDLEAFLIQNGVIEEKS
ncbi:Phosducin-like protein, partial [Caligus rogercresseyi]